MGSPQKILCLTRFKHPNRSIGFSEGMVSQLGERRGLGQLFSEPENWHIGSALPLVELTGDRRLLIENHRGILEYSQERISVQVKFGAISIVGNSLGLCYISEKQLIVVGEIHKLVLERR